VLAPLMIIPPSHVIVNPHQLAGASLPWAGSGSRWQSSSRSLRPSAAAREQASHAATDARIYCTQAASIAHLLKPALIFLSAPGMPSLSASRSFARANALSAIACSSDPHPALIISHLVSVFCDEPLLCNVGSGVQP
jgi:hypothetical protein